MDTYSVQYSVGEGSLNSLVPCFGVYLKLPPYYLPMKFGRLEQSVALTAYVVEIFYAQISWGQ